MTGIRFKLLGIGLVLLLLAISGVVWFFLSSAHQVDRLLKRAQESLAANDLVQADALVQNALSVEPRSSRALFLGGKIANQSGRAKEALNLLAQVRQGDPRFLEARSECGALALKLGHLSQAEKYFRDVLAVDVSNRAANSKLAYLLRLQGRNWESRPFVFQLMKQGQFERDHFYAALSHEWVWIDAREIAFLEFCHLQGYDGHLALLGPSRWTLTNDITAEKPLEVLRQLAMNEPLNVDAIAWYGAVLAANRRDEHFLRWQSKRSKLAESHPQTWYARANYLDRLGRQTEAAKCFWEAVRLDPNHRSATYQLGRLLSELGFSSESSLYLRRAERLAELDQLLHTGVKQQDNPNPAALRRMIELLEELGRSWEAWGWLHLIPKESIQSEEFSQLERRLRERSATAIESGVEMIAQLGLPNLDQINLPSPTPESFVPESRPDEQVATSHSTLQFVDEASSAGLSFHYFNGTSLTDESGRMFEFSGGGAGAVDFDRDGFPDLFLTQGSSWPPSQSESHRDRLFRNLGGREFFDVTEFALIDERNFSHGIAVGDFDNDGFPDLFIGNIGPNRLLKNQGDGTFQDVTSEADIAGNEWTLAGAIADFNQDSIPDLYVTNYLSGPDVFTRVCQHEGKSVQCLAGMFAGDRDRLHLGLGDGRFRDVSTESDVGARSGKGMGLVVGNILGDGGISVFVANDGLPNRLWHRAATNSDRGIRYQDVGMLYGVGTNTNGQAQASMGIAAGDLNSDGILDFFVTNFYKETNNLFVSDANGGYRDEAAAANVLDATRSTMGWGTQFVDADLDGDLDLVVANGHLGLRSSRGDPNRMRPHLWRNESTKSRVRFAMVPGGDYFENSYLGRGIASLDWNRDGKPDLCVTHVDHSVSLLSNRSESEGHWFELSLVGVIGDRDSVGATVNVQLADQTIIRHVTAGDGFGASNEKRLLIGVGKHPTLNKVMIRWPSGIEQEYQSIPAGGRYVAVEGTSHLRASN